MQKKLFQKFGVKLLLLGFLVLCLHSSGIIAVDRHENLQSLVQSETAYAQPAPASTPTPAASGTPATGSNKSSEKSICEQISSSEPAPKNEETEKFFNLLVDGIIVIEKALLSLNVPIVIVIGKLLSNEWVYLDTGIIKLLETMWLFVRNFVFTAFGVILMFAALAAVAGIGGEKNNLAARTLLPKFFIGMLFVPFTFLACKIVLDVGNLATTAAFSIVNEVGPGLTDSATADEFRYQIFCSPVGEIAEGEKWWNDEKKRNCIGDTLVVAVGKDEAKAMCTSNGTVDGIPINKNSITGGEEFVMAWGGEQPPQIGLFSARNAMFIYSYNIFHLADSLKIYDKDIKPKAGFGSLTGALLNLVTTILMTGLTLILNVAILVAFAVRMVMVWLLMIASPIAALDFASGGKIKGKFDIAKNFISLSFMPAVVGFVLSIGFLAYHILSPKILDATGQTITLFPFSIIIKGSTVLSFSNLVQLVFSLIIMIVIWKGVFLSLKMNKIVEKTISGIEKFGNEIGTIAKKSLSVIPIIPTGKGLTSPGALAKSLSYVESRIEEKKVDQVDDIGRDFGIKALQTRGLRLKPEHMEDLKSLASKSSTLTEDEAKRLLSYINTVGHDDSNQLRPELVTILKKHKVNEDLVKKVEEGKASKEEIVQALKETHIPGLEHVESKDIKSRGELSGEETHTSTTSSSPDKNTVTVKAVNQKATEVTIELEGGKNITLTGVTQHTRDKAVTDTANRAKVSTALDKALTDAGITNVSSDDKKKILDSLIPAPPASSPPTSPATP